MRVKVLLAVVWLALTAGAAAAQVPTGTISGRVLDQGGDAVPGVTVSATSPSLQGVRTTVTSAVGDFVLPLLPPGTYEVRFELTGFEPVTRRIAVAPTQTVSSDVSLAIAGLTEAVTVTANAGGVRRHGAGRHERQTGSRLDAANQPHAARQYPDGSERQGERTQQHQRRRRLAGDLGGDVVRQLVHGEWRGDHREPPRSAVHACSSRTRCRKRPSPPPAFRRNTAVSAAAW